MDEISKNRVHNNILKVGSKNLNTENWKVYHPSGRHMFTCGEKKANWYLDRNLAKLIGKKKITLTFSPKGNGFEDNEEFGRSIREARCVVSGIEDGLQRHHIVPYCYRTYFPERFKSTKLLVFLMLKQSQNLILTIRIHCEILVNQMR